MLKDIFGSLGFVIVGSDILFWAYFFIMDKVSVFESSDFGELRIIVDPKGDVWFVASDVAKSLGYINAKDAVKRHVDDDDSMLLQVSDNQWGVKRSILKTRYIDSIRIINESGLYSLILSSKLESAMDGNQLEYEFDNKNLDHITFKGDGKESFSFNRVLVENLIETFETMQDIYSDNYGIKVYTGNCIIQLNVNPKDPSESFFDVYDRDEMKLIYGIKISILKEMFII